MYGVDGYPHRYQGGSRLSQGTRPMQGLLMMTGISIKYIFVINTHEQDQF